MTDERLREAVTLFLAQHDSGMLGVGPIWCDGKCGPLDALRAALSDSRGDSGKTSGLPYGVEPFSAGYGFGLAIRSTPETSARVARETLHERQIRLNYERPPRRAKDDEAKGCE